MDTKAHLDCHFNTAARAGVVIAITGPTPVRDSHLNRRKSHIRRPQWLVLFRPWIPVGPWPTILFP